MITYLTLFEALQGVRDFTIDRPEECPAAIFELLRTQGFDLVQWGELLQTIYDADRGTGSATTVGPALMQIASGALGVFASSGFLSIGQSGDAAKMRLALLRDAGEPAPEGMSWPDSSLDPARHVR